MMPRVPCTEEEVSWYGQFEDKEGDSSESSSSNKPPGNIVETAAAANPHSIKRGQGSSIQKSPFTEAAFDLKIETEEDVAEYHRQMNDENPDFDITGGMLIAYGQNALRISI